MSQRPACLDVMVTLIASLALLAQPVHGQTDAFHILLTNDDGIESPGIQALARELATVGQVHLVAPCGERSGSSMSVALRDVLTVRPFNRDGQVIGHCVDTTPAGTVMLAITALSPEGGFDLVVSGINRGANVGTASHMSGTVGGAMMGAFYGLPAIAASLGSSGRDFHYPARFVARFIEDMRRHPSMPGVVFSINIPRATEEEIAGVAVEKMGGIHLRFAYEETQTGPDQRTFRPRIALATDAPEGTDTDAFMNDMITVTPLLFDWTAYPALDEVKGWTLSHVLGR